MKKLLVIDLKSLTTISQHGENLLLELLKNGAKLRCRGVFARQVSKQIASRMRRNGQGSNLMSRSGRKLSEGVDLWRDRSDDGPAPSTRRIRLLSKPWGYYLRSAICMSYRLPDRDGILYRLLYGDTRSFRNDV